MKRLISLDAFRGFVIAGMIIVNDPGSWSHVYGPLQHADWHGITPTDYVFPFFLFIVGVSVALSYTKLKASGASKSTLIQKLLKRGLTIFLLGVFLWVNGMLDYSENTTVYYIQKTLIIGLVCAFLFFTDKGNWQYIIGAILLGLSIWWMPDDWTTRIRIAGVLQRIALVFVACALLFLYTDWRMQLKIGIGILLAYWAVMCAIPVPIDDTITTALASGQVLSSSGMIDIGAIAQISETAIAANLEPGTNMEAWIDRKLIPGRLWQRTWDPEGIISTFPSIVNGIAGMLVGKVILEDKDIYNRITRVFVIGLVMLLLGGIWKWFFPFNKNLWTSSFVLHTSGLATLTLAAFMYIIDVWKKTNWAFIGRVFGMNSITAYVLHGLMGVYFYRGLNSWFLETMSGMGMELKMASFLYALLYVGVIFIPAYFLYKRKIYIKV